MQKKIQKELNELKIKRESKEIKESEYKYQESLLMSKLDDLTEEFEELRL